MEAYYSSVVKMQLGMYESIFLKKKNNNRHGDEARAREHGLSSSTDDATHRSKMLLGIIFGGRRRRRKVRDQQRYTIIFIYVDTFVGRPFGYLRPILTDRARRVARVGV